MGVKQLLAIELDSVRDLSLLKTLTDLLPVGDHDPNPCRKADGEKRPIASCRVPSSRGTAELLETCARSHNRPKAKCSASRGAFVTMMKSTDLRNSNDAFAARHY